ncbi:MAG TPA: hypothetical protein VKY92_15190, partial [Verrucomicrobiae bacterium]|nr:hypothetical protein [Verrucomicrobiae bacterium]
MLEINIRFSCRVAILAACLFNVGVRAENLPAERPTLAAEVRHEEGAGLLPTDRAYITAGTNKFAFLVPAEFRLDFVNETALELVTRDYSSRIGFKILPPQSAEAGDMTADLCSSWVTQQSPGGKII